MLTCFAFLTSAEMDSEDIFGLIVNFFCFCHKILDFHGDYFQFCSFTVEIGSKAEFMPAFGILLFSVYYVVIHI